MKKMLMTLLLITVSSASFAEGIVKSTKVFVGVSALSERQDYRNVMMIGDGAAEIYAVMTAIPDENGVKKSENIECSLGDKPKCSLSIDSSGKINSEMVK
jgi:hypothetical protein